MEVDDELDIIHFPCCNETIKLRKGKRHFCTICGQEIDMSASESRKVFLSHKGVDKSRVIDFKETLQLLGYEPWIDDDAMPAGTSLERGILQGMQDSCGVVFFVTPSFKDEGYLETEINYAIREKRKKGDRFSIITLQFDDIDGNLGEVPELLKGFVWKKPKTPLAAVREIVRALPVRPGTVDWRDGITGVVREPKVKSTTEELSLEAKEILKAAVAGGGRVTYLQYQGGASLSAGRKPMINDESSRTIALWVGGLEDLQRRRYIRCVNSKGEVFEVTREGYDAADRLRQVDDEEPS